MHIVTSAASLPSDQAEAPASVGAGCVGRFYLSINGRNHSRDELTISKPNTCQAVSGNLGATRESEIIESGGREILARARYVSFACQNATCFLRRFCYMTVTSSAVQSENHFAVVLRQHPIFFSILMFTVGNFSFATRASLLFVPSLMSCLF